MIRTFSSCNGVRFVLTSLDGAWFSLFFFCFVFNLVMPGGALFYLAVRESLTYLRNISGGSFFYLNSNKIRQQSPSILSKAKCVSQHCLKHDIPVLFAMQECSDKF